MYKHLTSVCSWSRPGRCRSEFCCSSAGTDTASTHRMPSSRDRSTMTSFYVRECSARIDGGGVKCRILRIWGEPIGRRQVDPDPEMRMHSSRDQPWCRDWTAMAWSRHGNVSMLKSRDHFRNQKVSTSFSMPLSQDWLPVMTGAGLFLFPVPIFVTWVVATVPVEWVLRRIAVVERRSLGCPWQRPTWETRADSDGSESPWATFGGRPRSSTTTGCSSSPEVECSSLTTSWRLVLGRRAWPSGGRPGPSSYRAFVVSHGRSPADADILGFSDSARHSETLEISSDHSGRSSRLSTNLHLLLGLRAYWTFCSYFLTTLLKYWCLFSGAIFNRFEAFKPTIAWNFSLCDWPYSWIDGFLLVNTGGDLPVMTSLRWRATIAHKGGSTKTNLNFCLYRWRPFHAFNSTPLVKLARLGVKWLCHADPIMSRWWPRGLREREGVGDRWKSPRFPPPPPMIGWSPPPDDRLSVRRQCGEKTPLQREHRMGDGSGKAEKCGREGGCVMLRRAEGGQVRREIRSSQ